ncbi:MAG: CotH kinase family protein [Bacteroidota bacterium]
MIRSACSLIVVLFLCNQGISQCPAGQWPVEINIVPDTYPDETSWNLFSNGIQVASGNYVSALVCVDSAACIRLDMLDSYGDGMCCGYGNGSYVISFNGNEVASGGEFTYSASHSFNCEPGTICEEPLVANLGTNTAQEADMFYSFTPELTGIYSVSTCNSTSCDTRLWIYDNCANVDINGSAAGALYYNDDSELCGIQSDINALFSAGTTYVIKIGLKENSSCAGELPFTISYDGALSSVIPIVNLTTVNDPINNDVKVKAHMEIIDNGPGQLNFADQLNFAYEGDIMVEWQGFTGPYYPKKNYDFDLIDSLGNEIDTSLLGLPAENDWLFKAEYLDNSLLNNTIAYEFARRMGRYAPRTRHCEVFLDGNYIGIYTLTEKVKRDQNRLDIAKLTSSDTLGSALTGGYIIEMNINGAPGSWNSAYLPINSATCGLPVEFKYVYPKADSILPVQGNYIKTYVDSFENALNSASFMDTATSYRKWIDVSTFIDFLIVNEFTMNYDSYGRSTYMYKEKDTDGGKLCIGPPWDYDRALANEANSGWVWENTHLGWPFPFWWSKMYSDSTYRHELACRWFSLRAADFGTDRFMSFIDSVTLPLFQGPAERNFAIWQTLGSDTYAAKILSLKTLLTNRLNWIDNTLEPFGAVLPELMIPEDTLVCEGSVYTAPYNPSYTYNWKPGPETPEILLDSAGIFVLEVSDEFGCYRNLPMQVATSSPDPTIIQVLHVPGDVNYSFTGVDGPSSTYLWDFGDNTAVQEGELVTHVFASEGFYTITLTVTDTLGCTSSSTKKIQVRDAQVQINILPNPTQNDPLIVHNLPEGEDFSFVLYDATGRKLVELIQPSSPFVLNTHGLSNGNYWLYCEFEGMRIAKRMIKL